MEYKNTMREMPENDRPYEKCLRYGAGYLQDHELLAVILRTGTPGFTVLDISREILNRSPGREGLLAIHQLSVGELMTIPGVGKVKAIQIRCLSELCKRLAAARLKSQPVFDHPARAAEYFMERLRHEEQEQVFLLMLDKRNHLLFQECISKGTVDASLVSPREILVSALKHQAVNLILLHNHPSGDPTPSRDDYTITERIRQSAEMIGLNLIDHIVIGDQKYYSFAENDELQQ